MFLSTSLTVFLLLAVSVAADTIVVRNSLLAKVPLRRRVNTNALRDLVKRDQAHAKQLQSRGKAKHSSSKEFASVGAIDAGSSYLAEVDVGSPPTKYNLIIDTGSSNTWVGAGTPYVETGTSVKTGQNVSVGYGSGFFNGTEYSDTVTLSSELVILGQSIGVAFNSTGFDGVDGILGIGPLDLTTHTLSPDRNATIPTVTNNLFRQGRIRADLVAVSFVPPTSANPEEDGELTFGNVDSTKFTGEITCIPHTKTANASGYWGINQTITYGSSGTTVLQNTAGIVDTGTTLLLIATDAFERYKYVTGASYDNATGLLTITKTQYSNLQSLFFTAGERRFEFTANAQIWPRVLNTQMGGEPGKIYLVVADLGSPSGMGLDFINGQSFLERFYSVYDTKTQGVGLATTPHTFATTN